MALDRLSLNQITIDQWTLAEAVEGCVRAGVPSIGPWRQRVAEAGLGASARRIRDSGLRVSSLCRGGFFPAATDADRRRADDDNRARSTRRPRSGPTCSCSCAARRSAATWAARGR